MSTRFRFNARAISVEMSAQAPVPDIEDLADSFLAPCLAYGAKHGTRKHKRSVAAILHIQKASCSETKFFALEDKLQEVDVDLVVRGQYKDAIVADTAIAPGCRGFASKGFCTLLSEEPKQQDFLRRYLGRIQEEPARRYYETRIERVRRRVNRRRKTTKHQALLDFMDTVKSDSDEDEEPQPDKGEELITSTSMDDIGREHRELCSALRGLLFPNHFKNNVCMMYTPMQFSPEGHRVSMERLKRRKDA